MYTNTEETTSSSPAQPMLQQVIEKAIAPSQSRKFRAVRTLLLTLVVLAGIGGVLVFSVLTSRPTWHTVLSDGKPGSLVVAIDCPDDWNSVPIPAMQMPADMSQHIIQLKRKAPTGLLGWWNRVVLHQNADAPDAATIMVTVVDDSVNRYSAVLDGEKQNASTSQGTEVLDRIEIGYKDARITLPNDPITFQRIQHPLGPALRIISQTNSFSPAKTSGTGAAGKKIGEYWYIVPQKTSANSISLLSISCSSTATEAQSLKPLYAEVIQRVHLVKKP